MGSASDDSVDGAILSGAGDVFTLRFPVVVGIEMLVNDSVHVNVSWGFDGGSGEAGFMAFGVSRKREEEFLGLVDGFLDGDGLVDPVDRGVDVFQPRESQDNVFISQVHDIEGGSADYSSDVEE